MFPLYTYVSTFLLDRLHPMVDINNKEPCRRLIISRMELENFKSYAGVQHIGPFHKVYACTSASPQVRWGFLSFSSVVFHKN